ncbi:hypothetical protein AGDE_14263 [Angomonas deanei]|nr:hypothetical protein AGDE_14263 [Angomonas deanei]|eukprot:EPY21155.1 hypothetical protein AGDE_14263 [Angomonas deanei]
MLRKSHRESGHNLDEYAKSGIVSDSDIPLRYALFYAVGKGILYLARTAREGQLELEKNQQAFFLEVVDSESDDDDGDDGSPSEKRKRLFQEDYDDDDEEEYEEENNDSDAQPRTGGESSDPGQTIFSPLDPLKEVICSVMAPLPALLNQLGPNVNQLYTAEEASELLQFIQYTHS